MIYKYYIYRHIRTDINIPFYVGIGTVGNNPSTKRYQYHRAYTYAKKSKSRSRHWCNIYNKCNENIDVDILFETDSWEEAQNKEREFIALYGRIDLGTGTLVNLTDGGEGANGAIVPYERRERISKSMKGMVKSQEQINKIAKALSGRSRPESVKQKLRETHAKIKFKHSEEAKIRIVNALIGRKVSEETRLKISQSNKGKTRNVGRVWSEETKLKMSLSAKNRKKKDGLQ